MEATNRPGRDRKHARVWQYARSAATGAATGLVVFAVTAAVMLAPVCAAEPDAIARAIGLDMLRTRMIEHRAVDWTPPGYFLVGYTVRVG